MRQELLKFKNKIRKRIWGTWREKLTKTKSRAFAPAFSDWGGLRNDFRTMDWVEVSRGLRFGASSNFLARMLV